MEESKQKKKGKAAGRDLILGAYKDFVLMEGKEPASVYLLGKKAGFSEAEFYQHFSTVPQVGADIWKALLEETEASVRNNPEYATFTGRDKLLLFYFSLVQHLKKERSFVNWSASGWIKPGRHGAARKLVSSWVKDFMEGVLREAEASGEVKGRGKIGNHYADALLLQFWFILDFWIKDESQDFEDSDALIEKSLGLAFDLLGEGPLEKALDLGRFLLGRVMPV
jgi:hypothetical protein